MMARGPEAAPEPSGSSPGHGAFGAHPAKAVHWSVQISIGDPYDAFAREIATAFAQAAPPSRITEIAARHGVELA